MAQQAVVRIVLQFSREAIKKGAVVTLASKVVGEMPIKICDYSPSMMRKQEEEEGEGEDYKYPSLHMPNFKKSNYEFRISSKE